MNTRPCPACEHGKLDIAELNRGSRCSYCHRLIETDFVWAVGLPVFTGLSAGLSFSFGINLLGWLLTLLTVGYTIAFDTVVPKYIPLKHYGDSD